MSDDSRQYSLRQEDDDSSGRSILSLRLPLSLVESLQPDSELLLLQHTAQRQTTPGDSTGQIRIRNPNDDSRRQDETLDIRTEAIGAISTEVYQRSPSNAEEMVRAGSIHARYVADLPRHVKDLGRKTRERLQEEKSKRREIVRLDHDPDEETSTRAQKRTFPAISLPVVKRKRKQPRSVHTKTTTRESTTGKQDSWMPDTSHVISLSDDQERSSFVRLYGLPVGVKPEFIRRFFSDLDPERVLVLASYDVHIRGWDVEMDRANTIVPRHKSTFRLLVKFPSHPAASLAVSRSGETLYVEQEDGEKIGIALAVKHVPRRMAQYLMENLAVDGVVGQSLQQTLQYTEKQLETNVLSVLWTMAIQDLSLEVLAKESSDDSRPWSWGFLSKDPHTPAGYQDLARQHNALVDEYERLQSAVLAMTLNGIIDQSRNPVLRLTMRASNQLVGEMDTIDQLCHRARAFRRKHMASEAFD